MFVYLVTTVGVFVYIQYMYAVQVHVHVHVWVYSGNVVCGALLHLSYSRCVCVYVVAACAVVYCV